MRASTRSRSHWSALHSPFPRQAEPIAHDGAAVYRRREPTATSLYPIVQHHLETFLAEAAEADPGGEGVPGWVEDDFRAYLRCGILAWGFARVRCDVCAGERLVAFSCKGRGVCPSCNARRMVEVAAHLTDHVLPPLGGAFAALGDTAEAVRLMQAYQPREDLHFQLHAKRDSWLGWTHGPHGKGILTPSPGAAPR